MLIVPLRLSVGAVLILASAVTCMAEAKIARFTTVAGNFDVLLNENEAPITVANFASYAQAGLYDNTFIHRSTTYDPSTIQVIQGGGFLIEGNTITPIPVTTPIPLEVGGGLSNERGTIAMARTAEPNSATSQWFFNVRDNLGLDPGVQGDGYAVFGRVMGNGIENVVDVLASVSVYDASAQLGAVFGELPLLSPNLNVESFLLFPKVDVVPFRVTQIQRVAEGCRVEWTPLSTNTPVNVERSTDLQAGAWTVVSSNNTNGSLVDLDPPAEGSFYRVVLP
jgi:peptidyl-prolyl cis-trans isomerase A (cyclophilin A)